MAVGFIPPSNCGFAERLSRGRGASPPRSPPAGGTVVTGDGPVWTRRDRPGPTGDTRARSWWGTGTATWGSPESFPGPRRPLRSLLPPGPAPAAIRSPCPRMCLFRSVAQLDPHCAASRVAFVHLVTRIYASSKPLHGRWLVEDRCTVGCTATPHPAAGRAGGAERGRCRRLGARFGSAVCSSAVATLQRRLLAGVVARTRLPLPEASGLPSGGAAARVSPRP